MEIKLNLFEKLLCVLLSFILGSLAVGAFLYVIVDLLFYTILDINIKSHYWLLLTFPFSIATYPECKKEMLERKIQKQLR